MSNSSRFVNRRKALGYTQEAVAKALKVTTRTVQLWESGSHVPKLTPMQLADLCDLLHCSPRDLAEDFLELANQN
jgi:transcriptional regulator with XRE-family HTH domain